MSLHAFVRASWGDRLLAIEALLELVAARIVTFLPARLYTRWLGRIGSSPEQDVRPDPRARKVGRIVERIGAVAPWGIKCLQTAIAVRRMLARRRIPSIVHLGLALDPADRARAGKGAHAWVIVGGEVVCGDGELDRYAVVGTFV